MSSDEDSDIMIEWAKLDTVKTFECKFILEYSYGAVYVYALRKFIFGQTMFTHFYFYFYLE